MNRGWRRRFSREPPIVAGTSLAPIEAAVDENPGEPDLKRPRLPVRPDVREHFDKRILHGFIGLSRIAQILERNAGGAALVQRDQLAEAFPGQLGLASLDEAADVNRQT